MAKTTPATKARPRKRTKKHHSRGGAEVQKHGSFFRCEGKSPIAVEEKVRAQAYELFRSAEAAAALPSRIGCRRFRDPGTVCSLRTA